MRLLHQRVKEMHWNCLRYCIGFPPEAWYDIADEVGILIQDEFPIWSHTPETKRKRNSPHEYAEWMRERWNHPCVVIWDANNETRSSETGPAIARVRALDLSSRPWDNSYNPPAGSRAMCSSRIHIIFRSELQAGCPRHGQPGPTRQLASQRRETRRHHQRVRLALAEP